MPAMVAVRHNERLKVYYQHLKIRGKYHGRSGGVMRKLLIIAHALYKMGKKYCEKI
jgi:hypothetical protein